MSVKLLHCIYEMEERFNETDERKQRLFESSGRYDCYCTFLGLLPSAVVKKAKAENYNAGKDEIRVYLSQDHL